MMDWPKARGLTEEQIPIVGYSLVAITIAVLAVLTRLYGLSPGFLLTAVIMAVMGHADDRKPLPAYEKFFWQCLCAVLIVYFEPNVLGIVTSKYSWWGGVLAVFFILGLVNAINFIDGIDGLAGLVILLGSLGFVLLSRSHSNLFPLVLCASLIAGMMLPFLYFNALKRRGFLGNVGSYFFSFVLAVMHLAAPLNAEEPIQRISLSGLCFLIPIADSCMVILMRLVTLRSPFRADKGHLHHRMVQTGIALRFILLGFGIIELGGVITAFVLNQAPGAARSWLPAIILLNNIGIVAILILMLEKASKRRVQAYFERLDIGEPIHYLKYRLQDSNGVPLSWFALRRMEARITTEIRITDICFCQKPDILFVALKTVQEPIKFIIARLDKAFAGEKVHAIPLADQGEFVKIIAHRQKPTLVKTKAHS